nr:hypothetical protein [Tanacetum cinerariifolium]
MWVDKEVPISEVDACLNACKMWKAIKRLKQGESINVQDLETKLYWEFGKFTSLDGESLKSYYSRFYNRMNELVRNQCDVTNHQVNVQFLLQLQPEWQRGKAIVNSLPPIYNQEPSMVAEDDEMSNDKEIDKLMALISLSGVRYENQRIGNVAGARETVDAADSGPIFDAEPLQKVSNDDYYNVFAIESEHPKLSKSVHDTYPIEQDEHNVIIDSLDMSYDREQIDQNDDDNDLANEQTNALMYKDLKKSQAELDRRNDVEYASQVEIDCAKDKGDLISYKMESQKSFNKYTQQINDLNQTILEMKKKLSAHQETISILSHAKEAQTKLYKTREDKELDKVIALENKVKVLDDIVYKTGQSVQTMNMLNNKCRTSFAKPEFLKKAQRGNPRLYDIDEVTNLQCDYLELLEKCECLEKELSKSKMLFSRYWIYYLERQAMQSSSAVGSLYLNRGNLSSLAVEKSSGSGNSLLAVEMT